MGDPNDILKQLQMVAEEVRRSKTGLGYSADLMAKLGMVVFGNMDALRDAIQAPDGQSWQSGMFAEAERRGSAEDDALRLHRDKMSLFSALLEVTTNGRWTDGEQRGEWAILNAVYETARDALGANEQSPRETGK